MTYRERSTLGRVTSSQVDALSIEVMQAQAAQHDAKTAWRTANDGHHRRVRALQAQLKRLLARQKAEWAEQDANPDLAFEAVTAPVAPPNGDTSKDHPDFARYEAALWDYLQSPRNPSTRATTRASFAATRDARHENYLKGKADGTLLVPGTTEPWV